jgi:hypothetical protein
MGRFHATSKIDDVSTGILNQSVRKYYLVIYHFQDLRIEEQNVRISNDYPSVKIHYRTDAIGSSNVIVVDELELDIQDGVQPAPLIINVGYVIDGLPTNEKDTVKVDRSGGGSSIEDTSVRVSFARTYLSWFGGSKLRKLMRK